MKINIELQYEENKGFAEDLTEGKFSFPIIHCIRSNNDDHQILSKTFNTKKKIYYVKELMIFL